MYRLQSEPASDNSPIAALYNVYAHRLFAYVRLRTTTREDAEDIVLEVFVAALESNVLLLRSEGEQSAWLWRVTYNKVADYSRQSMRRTAVHLEEVAKTVCVDDEQAPDQVALRTEEYAELRAYLEKMPEAQQEVLWLHFALGLRCTEIAQRLHKRDGAVRMLLSRSLKFLRAMYDRQKRGDLHDE
jgi:RNA polymerase sigma factor (sigma-70 family)